MWTWPCTWRREGGPGALAGVSRHPGAGTQGERLLCPDGARAQSWGPDGKPDDGLAASECPEGERDTGQRSKCAEPRGQHGAGDGQAPRAVAWGHGAAPVHRASTPVGPYPPAPPRQDAGFSVLIHSWGSSCGSPIHLRWAGLRPALGGGVLQWAQGWEPPQNRSTPCSMVPRAREP